MNTNIYDEYSGSGYLKTNDYSYTDGIADSTANIKM
jgi:hypothetical protein